MLSDVRVESVLNFVFWPILELLRDLSPFGSVLLKQQIEQLVLLLGKLLSIYLGVQLV